jgi:4-amino-4-deoxy-L-arabinose transferase-like glycosyltransferase
LTCAAVVFAIFVTFGLRVFRIDVSWDIFTDELYYLDVSRGVMHTLWLNETDGDRFYLHPPLLFFMEAAYMKLFSTKGDLFDQIYGVRFLGAAFAGLSGGSLLWLGRRLAGWPTGIAAVMILLWTLSPSG